MDPAAAESWSLARPGAHLDRSAICIAPSVSLEMDPSGWVYGCCANQLYPLGRIGRDRLKDLWGGPRAQVLREALGRWDLSVGCGACRWHLEHGRMDPDAAVYDFYEIPDVDSDGPVAMTFALSNRCNLGCVMCTPELSSTLRHRAGLAPLVSPYDDAFFEDLAQFLPGLKYAKFLGGEPFLIPEHHRVWDLMAEVGGPPRMQVTTNGTIWNARVESLLASAKVDITVSIDGATRDTYEAVRSGASFEAVERNIERFARYCRAEATELRLCFCLMPQNTHELAAMVRWTDRLGAALTVNVVTDLGLAVHDLPLEELEAILEGWMADAEAGGFGANRQVWEVQVDQLRSVIGERHRGIPPAARQAIPAPRGFLEVPVDLSGPVGWSWTDADATQPAVERERLSAWSQGGPVGELRGTPNGRITTVVAPLERLGLTGALVGGELGDVPTVMERVDGRTAWILGIDDPGTARSVRTVVMSREQPVRGVAGSIVRMVSLAADDGFVLLVAEDSIYESTTTVQLPSPIVN